MVHIQCEVVKRFKIKSVSEGNFFNIMMNRIKND